MTPKLRTEIAKREGMREGDVSKATLIVVPR
jgi:hypothetical protein